jgi:hypothetical protein
MIDHKKHLRALKDVNFSELECAHCGAVTKSPDGREGMCNFCEQEAETAAAARAEGGFIGEFRRMHAEFSYGAGKNAFSGIEKLLEGSNDPGAFYVTATFYLFMAESRYRDRNYSLPSFMEGNYDNIRGSLDLTAKGKEHLYRAVALAGSVPVPGSLDRERAYVGFMSQVKLHRLTEASSVLAQLSGLDANNPLTNYARMVYGVRARSKDAELGLSRALASKEANAYYYLAEHLARGGRLAEAEEVLVQLGKKADVRMSAQLLYTIRNVQEASRM